jgi:hypothetical protein
LHVLLFGEKIESGSQGITRSAGGIRGCGQHGGGYGVRHYVFLKRHASSLRLRILTHDNAPLALVQVRLAIRQKSV